MQVQQMEESVIYVGCAGWSIPKSHAADFLKTGSHLERYASRFRAVEINSSFYRPHRVGTYVRWADSVPEFFKFAVKVPKEITHSCRLVNIEEALDRFLMECAGLGAKLGPLLVQLPPSLKFDAATAHEFFTALRERFSGQVVCEPRHISWFSPEVENFLNNHQVARVAADPALTSEAAVPAGWDGLVYYRLHGSPRVYYSAYSADYLDSLGKNLAASAARGVPVWCIFDNTAEGAATADALGIIERLQS